MLRKAEGFVYITSVCPVHRKLSHHYFLLSFLPLYHYPSNIFFSLPFPFQSLLLSSLLFSSFFSPPYPTLPFYFLFSRLISPLPFPSLLPYPHSFSFFSFLFFSFLTSLGRCSVTAAIMSAPKGCHGLRSRGMRSDNGSFAVHTVDTV